MTAAALFLGTGASMGIPVIGCDCAVCNSSLPANKRLRPSLLLTIGDKRYVVDIGPDFRTQALQHQIDRLDGVIITHSHYDHIAGLDELRIYFFREKIPVPCLVSPETLEEIKIRYHYIMPPSQEDVSHVMKFDFQVLEGHEGETTFEGLSLRYFSYFQKGMKVTGIRIKDFAYVVDILEYPESIYKQLEGVQTLVIDGMTWERTAAHLGIQEVIEFAKKIGCEKTYLTHVAHETDHDVMNAKLPNGMEMAYDGLKIRLW
ncbi:MAG: MBL fold metallo-hydrolase [Simkania sp.]|nr:MBL fold metallo-hydrolase [Simkania sp.]